MRMGLNRKPEEGSGTVEVATGIAGRVLLYSCIDYVLFYLQDYSVAYLPIIHCKAGASM